MPYQSPKFIRLPQIYTQPFPSYLLTLIPSNSSISLPKINSKLPAICQKSPRFLLIHHYYSNQRKWELLPQMSLELNGHPFPHCSSGSSTVCCISLAGIGGPPVRLKAFLSRSSLSLEGKGESDGEENGEDKWAGGSLFPIYSTRFPIHFPRGKALFANPKPKI